jgi:polysaccharide export outer membrane protein
MRNTFEVLTTVGVLAYMIGFSMTTAEAQNVFQPSASSQVATPPSLGGPPAMHDPVAGMERQPSAPQFAQAITGSPEAPDYRLGPGDKVRVTVFGQPDLTGTYSVDGTGRISFALVGRLDVGGLTAAEVQQLLVSKLSPNYIREASVTVEVINYRPFYILGEVRAPGSYSYVSGMTVLEAVVVAGGYTYRAREDSFYVLRTSRHNKEQLQADENTLVQPGDVIKVRERFF